MVRARGGPRGEPCSRGSKGALRVPFVIRWPDKHVASLKAHPSIEPGTPDPYEPPR
jgi:hypothetical protein